MVVPGGGVSALVSGEPRRQGIHLPTCDPVESPITGLGVSLTARVAWYDHLMIVLQGREIVVVVSGSVPLRGEEAESCTIG